MAAAIALTNLISRTSATATVSGATASTAYNVVVTHVDGSTQTIPIKTDGTGAATVMFVPSAAGSVTAALWSVAASQATTSGSTKHE